MIMMTYIKASWLAGNRKEDCSAELFRLFGIVDHGLINAIYDILDLELATLVFSQLSKKV